MKTRCELAKAILEAKSKKVWKARKRNKKTVWRLLPYSWRDVARELYPNENENRMGALLYKIANHPEYQPGRQICEQLRLVYMVSVPVCPDCGIAHVSKRCPARRKPPINWRHLFGMSNEELERRLQAVL